VVLDCYTEAVVVDGYKAQEVPLYGELEEVVVQVVAVREVPEAIHDSVETVAQELHLALLVLALFLVVVEEQLTTQERQAQEPTEG
jgi:hypothetical protein